MYECFHCGARAVIGDSDYDSGDYGYKEGGVIHECHCENCGALITYAILPEDSEETGEVLELFEDPDQMAFDEERTILNCAVQILKNTETGEESSGWREMTRGEKLTEAFRTLAEETGIINT